MVALPAISRFPRPAFQKDAFKTPPHHQVTRNRSHGIIGDLAYRLIS